MANQNVFGPATRVTNQAVADLPVADTVNEAGGVAFSSPAWHDLVQLAFTGMFPDGTYYDDKAGQTQLTRLVKLTDQVNDPVRLARLAVAARLGGYMKDMPMALLVLLAAPSAAERDLERQEKLIREHIVSLTALAGLTNLPRHERHARLGADPAFEALGMQQRVIGRERTKLGQIRAKIFHAVFNRIVDDGKVLKTLFQMVRSGALGKRSLTAMFQTAFSRWFTIKGDGAILSASIGNKPTLRDVLRCARPTPRDDSRRALLGWLVDKPVEKWTPKGHPRKVTRDDLPEVVKLLERYRKAETAAEQVQLLQQMEGTYVRWDLLSDAAKGELTWRQIVRQMMGHQALRMNLATMERHGVFKDPETVTYVAERLADPAEVRRTKQFPYTFYSAYKAAGPGLPAEIRRSLSRAADIACQNIPDVGGPLVIGVDVSDSMISPATGWRADKTSGLTCREAAALFAAALLKRNPGSALVPFSHALYPDFRYDPDDSILSITDQLAAVPTGGTDVHLPVSAAVTPSVWSHELRRTVHLIPDRPWAGAVILSDNESWVTPSVPTYRQPPGIVDARGHYLRQGTTALMASWEALRKKQKGSAYPDPKLVCFDMQCYGTTQAPERADVLNIGGFSDFSFALVADFFRGTLDLEHRWEKLVDSVSLWTRVAGA